MWNEIWEWLQEWGLYLLFAIITITELIIGCINKHKANDTETTLEEQNEALKAILKKLIEKEKK